MSDDVQKTSSKTSKTDADKAGETSEGAKDGSYQDQYPQDGDLSLGLQFDSPAAQNQDTYPGQSWLPSDCKFPTEAPPGSEVDGKDVPEDYPGKAWLPKGHVYPTPKKGPTLITHTMAMQNPGDCPKCRLGWVEEHFTPCGIIIGALFFPIGILCCLLLREYKCSYCGTEFNSDELKDHTNAMRADNTHV